VAFIGRTRKGSKKGYKRGKVGRFKSKKEGFE